MWNRQMPLNLYATTDFGGHFSVGVAAIALATTEAEARKLISEQLEAVGLGKQDDFTLIKVPMRPHALILNNGDY